MSAPPDGGWAGRAQAALRRVPSPRPLTAAHVDRLEVQLAARILQAPAARRPGWKLGWVLGLMTAAGGAGASIHHLATRRTEAPVAARTFQGRETIARQPKTTLPPAVELAPPLRPRAIAPSGPRPPVSRLTIESRMLGTAVRKLRRDGEPAAALALLDDYARRFPKGLLAPEAILARVDALQALGRLHEALALLDGLDVSVLPRARQLLVLRGELRAMFGKHAAARTDFDALIEAAAAPDGPLGERALWGRAASLAAMGDVAASRRDLTRYLVRFPSGRHAGEARALLAGASP